MGTPAPTRPLRRLIPKGRSATVAQADSPNRKRKGQDAGGVDVCQPIKSQRAVGVAKDRMSTFPEFVNPEELIQNGERPVQHEDRSKSKFEDVLSILPTVIAPPGIAPPNGTSLPTRLLSESSTQSRQSCNSAVFPDEDVRGTIYPMGLGSWDSDLSPSIISSVESYPTSGVTAPSAQLSSKSSNPWMRMRIPWLTATLENSLQSDHVHPGATPTQTSEHLTPVSLGIPNCMSDLSVMRCGWILKLTWHPVVFTAQDPDLNIIIPKTEFPIQLLPEGLEASVSPPTIPPACPQALRNNSLPHQRNSLRQYGSCPHCQQLWLTHSECIVMTSTNTQGNKQLHNSFQELKSHIQGHWFGSSIPCSVCQDYLFDHLWTLQRLSNINLQDLRSGQITMKLEQEVMALRNHVRENHMGS